MRFLLYSIAVHTPLHGLFFINKNPKEFRENPRYCICFSYMLASLIITPDRCVRPKTIKWKIWTTFTMAYGTSSTCVPLAVLLHTNGMVRTLWNRWLTVLDHFDLIFLMGKQKRTLREVAGGFQERAKVNSTSQKYISVSCVLTTTNTMNVPTLFGFFWFFFSTTSPKA